MQFSKKFLGASLGLVLISFFFWIATRQPDHAVVAATPSDSGVNQAFESLNKKMGKKETAIPVETAPIIRGPLIQRVLTQGRVHAYRKADLKNEIAGRLLSLKVTDGDFVKKGQIIAEIDEREYRLNFEEANSAYLSAQADFLVYDESLKGLNIEKKAAGGLAQLRDRFEKGLLSEDDFKRQKLHLELDLVRSGAKRRDVIAAKTLDQARINLARRKLDLEKCLVRAPFEGVVFNVAVSEGALLAASETLVTLVNLSDLAVKAKILESEIGQVRKGREVTLEFAALPELEPIRGQVQALSPFVDESCTFESW